MNQCPVERRGLSPATCLLLVMLALVPLLLPAVPPLTDLPGHMGRFLIQMDGGRSADLARWYSFRWGLLPNLGTDILAWVIEPLIGLGPTMKVIAMLIVALQAAGYLLLSRVAHGRVEATAIFAIPLALGAPFQFGFLNFTFATALATLALALWLSPAMTRAPVRRWVLFSLIGTVVWVSHLAAWSVLCVLVGCCELAARHERTGRVWPSLAGGFVASSCLLVPQLASFALPGPGERLPTGGWFEMGVKLHHVANVLSDRWEAWDMLCAAALAVLIVHAWRSPRYELHKGLALGACALLALFFAMPGTVFGSAFADMRLMPTIFALALICVRPSVEAGAAIRHRLLWAALAFAALRLVGSTVSMALWDREITAEQSVLQVVPRGGQLVTLVALPCRPLVMQGRVRDTHVGSYALIRRHAFANDQWAMPGGQLLTIHNPLAGPFQDASTATTIAETCQGRNLHMDAVADIPAAVPLLWVVWHTPELPMPGWREMRRSGNSVLYRRQTP